MKNPAAPAVKREAEEDWGRYCSRSRVQCGLTQHFDADGDNWFGHSNTPPWSDRGGALVLGTRRSSLPISPIRARQVSLNRKLSLQKAHFCDRHHIASAMAELRLLFVDRTAYAVVLRSSEILSPAHAGLFSPLDFLR